MIVKEEVGKSIILWEPISERVMLMRVKMDQINVLILQIYAPCENEEEEKKDRFYECLDQVIKDHRKGRECLVVMGDFNGKVGCNKEDDQHNMLGYHRMAKKKI